MIDAGKQIYIMPYIINYVPLGGTLILNRELSGADPVPGAVSGCSHFKADQVQFHVEGVR